MQSSLIVVLIISIVTFELLRFCEQLYRFMQSSLIVLIVLLIICMHSIIVTFEFLCTLSINDLNRPLIWF